MEDLRFPIGKMEREASVTREMRRALIAEIGRAAPALRAAVEGLTDAQLETPYREGGWTVRQVVHHLADSHLNGYVRIRRALTEDGPPVSEYDQERWAELPDARSAPVELSLGLLEALHARWVRLLEGIPEADFSRVLVHPKHGRITVDDALQIYAWHGRHHVAQVTRLREREGWSRGAGPAEIPARSED